MSLRERILRVLCSAIWELQSEICVILDYNFLHLNKRFAYLLSWLLSHKIYWFWESRVNAPCIWEPCDDCNFQGVL
jgi:hypothetical protein